MRFALLAILALCLVPSPASAYEEGAGLLRSDREGALPKTLWSKQPRSEIGYLLKNLPADAPLRSLQQIKVNTLLSVYDLSEIKNDIEPSEDNNLLTLRLQKLIEMGQWEQAFRLYTTSVNDPENNNNLAQTGILLVLLKNGLATACLEAKVFSKRFDSTAFWKQIDTACNIELGTAVASTADFDSSETLKNIYKNEEFKISANDINRLSSLSTLELALLSSKGRINYENFDINVKIPPYLVKAFLKDSKFPTEHLKILTEIAVQQAILPESPLSDTVQAYAESLDKRTQGEIIDLIAHRLKRGQNVPFTELKKLEESAAENPENYFYLQYVSVSQPMGENIVIPDAQLSTADTLLSAKSGNKVNFIKSLLDKSYEFSNNPANVYEKHISVTPDGSLVTKGNQLDWLKETINNNFAGLSLLIMLSNIENNAWVNSSVDMSEEKTFNMLNNLSNVGLIDQAHQIAREELANLMVYYKN